MALLYILTLLLSSISSTHAFWRLLCDGSTGLARMDPLMNPGTIGEHAHSIKGGSGESQFFLSPNWKFRDTVIYLTSFSFYIDKSDLFRILSMDES